jgi:hypothetical protein
MSRGRRHRSAEEWALLVAEYRAGCEDDAEFCQRHKLSLHTFRKHKYGKRAKRDQAADNPSGFVEVAVSARESERHITVHGLEGVRIEVPVSVGVQVVAELARALHHGR